MKTVKCKGVSVDSECDFSAGYTESKLVFLSYQNVSSFFWSSDSKINLIFSPHKKEKESVTKTGNAFIVPSVLCQREASETREKKTEIVWLLGVWRFHS